MPATTMGPTLLVFQCSDIHNCIFGVILTYYCLEYYYMITAGLRLPPIAQKTCMLGSLVTLNCP